jgi:Icc-related predicted phosphoesterase
MKILTVSDQVGQVFYDEKELQCFRDVDLVLSCGDLPPEYLTYLAASLNAPLFYVKGNHDIRYAKQPAGCLDVHARIVEFRGLRIMGLEGSRWYNGGPNQYTEGQMRMTVLGLRPLLWWRGGIDIVIAHAPPRFVHDAEDQCHRGFRTFRTLIDKFCPRYFIHGHIHAHFDDPCERETIVGRTRVVNAFGYHVLEIENDPAD